MILYYIEDSITELNINTAIRTRSIKGLATLTGHNPSRGMGARGSVKFIYNNSELNGDTIIIPNYTQILNLSNGLKYLIILPFVPVPKNTSTPPLCPVFIIHASSS